MTKKSHLSGIVGPIVTYQLNGQNVVRSLPSKRKKQSPKQLSQITKMKETIEFLRGIRPIVKFSYPSDNPFTNGHVLARSSILRNAFEGTYPDLIFDFSKVELSSATKSGIASISASSDHTQLNLDILLDKGIDKNGLSIVVVHESGREALQTYSYGPFSYRKDNHYEVDLIRQNSHGPVQHFWVMVLYPLRMEYLKSCYFSLSENEPSPKTVYYSD